MKPSPGTTDLSRGLAAILTVLVSAQALAAQAVQLPSVRNFSSSGGVLVPDGGTALLGGNRSSAMGASSRGVPLLPSRPHRSIGAQATAAGVSVTATMIDLDEMDRQILGYDPRDRSGRRSDRVARKSVGDEIAEAKSLVRNARRAWQAGQTSTAKHAYELAIERLRKLAKNEHHSAPTSGAPGSEQGPRDAEHPAYLLAFAKAEFARFFPVASRPSPVQP